MIALRIRSSLLLIALALLALASPPDARSYRGDCCQPISTGVSPSFTDCIYTLRTAAHEMECDACVCDADGSGAIRTSDALLCLKVFTGEDVQLSCPECTTPDALAVFSSTTTTSLGAPGATIPPTAPSTTVTTVPGGGTCLSEVTFHVPEAVTLGALQFDVDTL